MNAYVSLDTLKSSGVLNITGSGDDARLRGLAENVSRMVDRYCNRHFYVLEASRKFDGDGTLRLLVPDLASIDAGGLKTDDDKDRTFGTTWAATDYLLAPSNADPAAASNPESRPYTAIEVDVDAGTKSGFPTGRETVQVAGQWGWWRHLKRASETANAVADATTTSVTVSSRADVEAGHTILIDSEQLYVRSYSGNTLTVDRGVNGTTAASHSGGAAIDIYEYPGAVVEATIMQTARLWRRKDSAFSTDSGFRETGQARVSAGLDPDAMLLLGLHRKHAVGVGV
ncbi:MAG: hypothetical protein O3A47_03115 [Chloroflexi bacterium]|nr:hypothetical protein [Chloroflexota bacterium]